MAVGFYQAQNENINGIPCLRINSNDGENKEGWVMAQMEIIQCRKHRAGGEHQLRLRI